MSITPWVCGRSSRSSDLQETDNRERVADGGAFVVCDTAEDTEGTGMRVLLGPEALDPDPYLAILTRNGIHWGMVEMEPGGHQPT